MLPWIEARADRGDHRSVLDHGYQTDLVRWAEGQAQALRDAARTASNLPIDWENIAEEIDDLAKSDRRALRSHIRSVIVHLMKLEVSPATMPRAGWRTSILNARIEIRTLLEDSPSLRASLDDVIADETGHARRLVTLALAEHSEAPQRPVVGISYTPNQVVDDWDPG
jgi:hypothetical protein